MAPPIPFADPAWHNHPSPYYNEHHAAWRDVVRKFVDEKLIPNREEWEAAEVIPDEIYEEAGRLGILASCIHWPELPGLPPRPKGYDPFFGAITMDEIARSASGGVVWGLLGGLGISQTPIFVDGSDEMKEKVLIPVLMGKKKAALCVSEATAGSDVANLKTTAEENENGDYVVNGLKKWITGGLFADYYTVAARTGGEGSGMGGVSLILIERNRAGVSTRRMDCMGAKGSGTAFVEFDDVVVPKENYIGDVFSLLRNFIMERVGIAIQATRFARCCMTESVEWTRRRKVFGKPLVDNAVVASKLSMMMLRVNASQAFIDSLIYRLIVLEKEGEESGDDNWMDGVLKMGAEAMHCKVLATDTFDECARDAAMLLGGNSYTKGNRVEHLYRQTISLNVPGGSRDVLVASAAKMALKGML